MDAVNDTDFIKHFIDFPELMRYVGSECVSGCFTVLATRLQTFPLLFPLTLVSLVLMSPRQSGITAVNVIKEMLEVDSRQDSSRKL